MSIMVEINPHTDETTRKLISWQEKDIHHIYQHKQNRAYKVVIRGFAISFH